MFDRSTAAWRRPQWLGIGILAAIISIGLTGGFALAQEPKAEAEKAAAPAGEPPPATSAAEEPPVERKNFLRFVFDASPILFFIIGGLSVYLVTVIINAFLVLRLPLIIPPHVVQSLEALLGEKKYKEAYELIAKEPSLFSRALTAGVSHLSHGYESALEHLMTVVEDGKLAMEHRISPVSTFGQLGPMIGLFGTVIGMILAFMTISGGEQPKPSELAKEIAIALCATLEGLTLALPSIYFFALFRNKVQRLVFELERVAEGYLLRFAAALKK